MNICLATNIYHPAIGGIPNYYKWLATILHAQQHTVIVLTIDEKDSTGNDSIENRDNSIVVTLRNTYHHYLEKFSQYFRPGSYAAHKWISMGWAMKDWLTHNQAKYNIDIIETTDFGGAGIFLVDKSLPPVIVIGHSSATQIARHSYMQHDAHLKIIKVLESLSFKYADAIITQSPLNQASLGSLTKRSIHFSRAPWIPPRLTGFEPQLPQTNLVVVSSLQYIKGAETMITALEILAEKNQPRAVYWIGGDSHSAPGGKRVSEYFAEHYRTIWGKFFIWLGEMKHSTTIQFIRQSNCVIIPSTWETFNYVALEAAFYGRRIIITDQTGASYLFRNSPGVIIIPAGNPGALAMALENISLNPVVDASLNDPSWLREYFKAGMVMEDRLKIYESAIHYRLNRKDMGEALASLNFLDSYTGKGRKFYYQIRKTLKRLIKGT